jgi:hypothetical protein
MIERWFQRNRGRTGALLVYAAVLVPLAGILRGDFTTFAGFTLLGLVPLLVSLRLVDRAVAETAGVEPLNETSGFRRGERPPLLAPLRQAAGTAL